MSQKKHSGVECWNGSLEYEQHSKRAELSLSMCAGYGTFPFWNLAHIEKKTTHSDAEKAVGSSEYRLISIPCIWFLTESEWYQLWDIREEIQVVKGLKYITQSSMIKTCYFRMKIFKEYEIVLTWNPLKCWKCLKNDHKI